MACKSITALPAGSSILSGEEIFPGNDSFGVTRKYNVGEMAQSATRFNSDLQYRAGTQVISTINGNIYRATVNTTGSPESTPGEWALEAVLNNTILRVPSEFVTIIAAMEYLGGAVLSAPVVIEVTSGSYNYTTTQIDLSHPYGELITIRGNPVTPASCSLSFSALPSPPSSPYINADSGSIFASGKSGVTLDGFSILKSGGLPAFGHCGVLASNGATINLTSKVIINDFYADIATLDGGIVITAGGVGDSVALTTAAGYNGIYASNATVVAPYVSISGGGNAVFADREGFVQVNNATIDAAIVDAFVLDSGHARANNATIGAVDIVVFSTGSSSLVTTGATIAAPSITTVRVDGQIVYNDTTLTGNSINVANANINAGTLQPSILKVRDTLPLTGLQGGSGVLDGAGVLTVVATWVTANTIIIPAFNTTTGVGPAFQVAITPATSFTITSAAGATDATKAVNWHAIVYP